MGVVHGCYMHIDVFKKLAWTTEKLTRIISNILLFKTVIRTRK